MASFAVASYSIPITPSSVIHLQTLMVHITLDLLRKWAGQDNGQLPKWEMTLDQRSIEKIEVINKYCPRLKILRLENNLIPRIENLYRLKVRNA